MAVSRWMPDTNTLSDLIRDPRGAMLRRLSAAESDAVCTSIVVASELRFGARREGSEVLSRRVDQRLDTLTLVTRNVRELERVPGLLVADWLTAPHDAQAARLVRPGRAGSTRSRR